MVQSRRGRGLDAQRLPDELDALLGDLVAVAEDAQHDAVGWAVSDARLDSDARRARSALLTRAKKAWTSLSTGVDWAASGLFGDRLSSDAFSLASAGPDDRREMVISARGPGCEDVRTGDGRVVGVGTESSLESSCSLRRSTTLGPRSVRGARGSGVVTSRMKTARTLRGYSAASST